MKASNLLFAAALASAAFVARPAAALLIPGGPTKSAAADCYGELSVEPLSESAVTLNEKGVPTVTCSDGDDTCDLDTQVDGTCTFGVSVCINQTNVEGCTPPSGLDKVTASGKAKGGGGKIVIAAPQLLDGSACGSFLEFPVPVKNSTKAGKGTVKIKATAPKGTKPKKDGDKITFVCNPSPPECDASTRTISCPANAAGGPDQLTLVVAASGNDLDNGWTGVSQNFAVTPNGSINVCLSECDTSSDTECTGNGAVGDGTLNGLTFGAPLPLLASNVPVCVVNRFKDPITGTANFGTGDVDLHVTLLADTFFTNASEVCPRCNNSKCTSGKNVNKACTVDAQLFVAEGEGDRNYNLSEDCPPLGNPVATLDIDFNPLTSGDTGVLAGGANPPCPRSGGPGINPQPNSCGAAGCGAQCTGSACVQMVPNPVNPEQLVCQDNKGGISQQCCNNNTSRSCFPLENGGTLSRTGRAQIPAPELPDTSFPKTGTGTVSSVFCEAATGNASIDGTTGLPGPAALLLSGCQYWLKQ